MVSVVQYLRVALITASMPVVVTLVYHAEKYTEARRTVTANRFAPWYLSIGMLIALIVLVGATGGRFIRLPARVCSGRWR